MSHTHDRRHDDSGSAVPVVDVEPFFDSPASAAESDVVNQVRRACEAIGFLAIRGHGVDATTISEMCDVTRQYFELPLGEKLAHDGDATGYRPAESGSLARTLGRDAPGDLCETFRYTPNTTRAAENSAQFSEDSIRDAFPPEPVHMAATWGRWFATMEHLAARMMTIFARALDLPDDWFTAYFERHSSALIANYYPPFQSPRKEGQLRRGAHTDFGVLTILYQTADDGGLEVRRPGSEEWLHVPFSPDTFVLNLGDMMERWTNGRWTSTLHRVVNPGSGSTMTEARISLPFFYRPDPSARIEVIDTCHGPDQPARYQPVNAGEWMAAKQQQIYST